MVEPNDWRLTGQERYLKGVELNRRAYRRYQTNLNWDHDHCEFCGGKFMENGTDALREGYCTPDEYYWICPSCFRDFEAQFEWSVSSTPQDD